MNDRITLAWLRERDACWSDEQIESLLPPDGCTILEALDCAAVPVEDRIWLGIDWLPAREQRLFACWCAARALRQAGVEDIRSWRAVWTSARYACGKATGDELFAARDAAWYVARNAARDAAWYAARDAVRDAAWYAAWCAARDAAESAARDAVRDAAWYAAWCAARDVQLRQIQSMCEAIR